MKSILLTKYGASSQAFEFVEREIPTPRPGEVCIKVASFGLNFADVMARRGLYQDAPSLPACLGYDVAGTIYAVAEDVNDFVVGERVFGMTRFGGYSEYVCTAAAGVAKTPLGMDSPTATALATQYATAYHCAYEAVRLHEGDRVLIQAGAGGVGTALVQFAKHNKCRIAATASSAKINHLKDYGVDLAIDYTKSDFVKIIEQAWGKNPIDIAFDSVGGRSFVKSYKLLSPGGKIVPYGAAAQITGGKTGKLKAARVGLGFGFFSPIPLLMKSQAIIGVNMLRIADHRPHILKEGMQRVSQLTEQGILKPVISKVFGAAHIAKAHDYLESRKSTGKVALTW